MKAEFTLDSGITLCVKPENLQLMDNNGKNTILVVKTEQTVIPLVFFGAVLASPDELKAREQATKA